MLLREEVEILTDDNFESIHDKLAEVGARTLLATLAALRDGTLVAIPQDNGAATYAAKIEKEDRLLDFSRDAEAVHNLIRGLSPIPLAFTHTPDGKLLKVPAARVARPAADGSLAAPGTVLSLEGGIEVACDRGSVLLTTVTPEGKSRMSAADYVRGRKLSLGDILA